MRSILCASLLCIAFNTAVTRCADPPASADLPKVVLLGDSIRMSYAPIVARELEGRAVVISSKDNGGDSSRELENLDKWAISHQPAVVHFNAGIHDIKKQKTGGTFQVPPEQYAANLRKIVERLRKETKATVLFATTTPVFDDRAAQARPTATYELLEASAAEYNDIARRMMAELNVPVNDLRAALGSADEQAEAISSDGIHLTRAAQEKLGKAVAAFVAQRLPTATAHAAPLIESFGANTELGSAQAVAVGAVDLLHTCQLFPLLPGGEPAASSESAQAEYLLDELDALLAQAGSDLSQLVRLNVYLAADAARDGVQRVLAGKFAGKRPPAVSYTVGTLARPGVQVAIDAVAVTARRSTAGRATLLPATVRAQHAAPGAAPLAVLPHGAKVYVSGDASSGDMATATANTMNSLSRTLEQLGLDRSHIVQLKCFLQPMSQVSVVEQELAKFFADTRLPPVILVEWTLSGPIEIELIAAAPADSRAAQLVADDTVAYFTPAGVKASPVFSRVACINSPRTIYTAGLYSRTAGSGADEVRDVFAQLKSLVEQSGSDLRHLVKATYYVATNDASTQLGALRPDFYDPPRPPAASKAGVTATGMPGRNLMIDMIAVPVR